MKEAIAQIKSSRDAFIFADKTNNLYKSSSEEYKKLLFNNLKNLTENLKKPLEKAVNMEAKHISKRLELDNRIKCRAKNTAFILLKDHKPNFQLSLPCRLSILPKVTLAKLVNQS